MEDLEIQLIPADQLKPWKKNARTHSKKQVRQVAKSIEEYGFTNPILIDEDYNILAGHGRLLAAQLLKMEQVPCVLLSHMSPAQKRAYRIADNKLALNAGWDEELLAHEFNALIELDSDFDIELTGFSISETDIIIEGYKPVEDNDPAEDLLPVDLSSVPDVEFGDIWQLGTHRLICADALDPLTVSALMDSQLADMIFTDPPYNVKIDGNVCGKGSIKHDEFAMASGEMDENTFTEFLFQSFQNQIEHSIDGSIHFICMDWRHIREITAAGDRAYTELKNVITWVKDNGGMGTFYRSRHELIFAFKHGNAPHINSFELGQHGRYRTNVWEYKGMNSAGAGRLEKLALHPTVKPVQLIADAIKDVSPRGGRVLDLFAGSGSTLIAAHKTGRRAYLAELEPQYCRVIIKRWQDYAHDDAELIYRRNEAA